MTGLAGLEFCLVFLLQATSPEGYAPESTGTFCKEPILKICEALRKDDAGLRVEEGRKAIREALFSPDQRVRDASVRLLSTLSDQMDLRPYAGIFEEFCGATSRCFWTPEKADHAELRFGARETRVKIFEWAIRSGATKLPRGTSLLRTMAVRWAAWQGLDELAPLAEEYLSTLTDHYKKRFSLEDVPALFELAGGAESEREAASVAMGRLAKLPDEEFCRHMDEDEPYRKAVLALGAAACRIDILSGKAPAGCDLLVGIVERQKRRFPNGHFQEGDIVFSEPEPLPQWLNQLHGIARGRSSAPSNVAGTGTPLARRSTRPTGIDPCTLPELPVLWSQGWYTGKYFVVLSDLSGATSEEVSVADGIQGHRTRETIRLKLDIRDRSGGRPTFPVVMRVWLSDNSLGSLSAAGKNQHCRSVNLFWNRAGSAGSSLVDFEEIDYTIGLRAAVAGLLPALEKPGGTIPLWKQTEELHVRFGEFKDGGETVTHEGDAVYGVRPEDETLQDPVPRPFEALLPRKSGSLEATFFGSDLGPDEVRVLEPRRQYVAMVDRARKEDTRPVVCFSQRENGERVTRGESVVLRRLGTTPVFVGSLLLLPQGYPDASSVPGRMLRAPAVVIPLGLGAIGCEEPSPRDLPKPAP